MLALGPIIGPPQSIHNKQWIYENYKITIEATIVFCNENVDSMKKALFILAKYEA